MNSGIKNEYEFINYLNNQKFQNVHIIFQELLVRLFSNLDNNSKIKAYKYGRYSKTDIVIEVNNVKKGISIKSGIKNSVHIEPIKDFLLFLEKLKCNNLDTLLYYLYSDGTNNNTGINRISSLEYKIAHPNDIELINDSLKLFKKELITRFLFKTDINYKVEVDAIIYGSVNDFLWATKDEILNYLDNNKKESSGVRVGNLFIQLWNKNLKYNEKYEYCRNYIQVKWYSIFDDIIQIMCDREKVRV